MSKKEEDEDEEKRALEKRNDDEEEDDDDDDDDESTIKQDEEEKEETEKEGDRRLREKEMEEMSRELEENKQRMRETLGFSLDEFNLGEQLLKPSINFAQELMRLIDTNLEPFENDHYFGTSGVTDANPYFADDTTTHSDETVTNNNPRGQQLITPSRSSSSPSPSRAGTVRLIRSTTSPRRRRTLEAKTPRTSSSSSLANRMVIIERGAVTGAGASRRTASLGAAAAGKKFKRRKPTQPVPPLSPSTTSNLVIEEQVAKSVRHLKEIVYLGTGTFTGYDRRAGSERFQANRKANKESNSGRLKTMIAQMNAKLIGLVDGFFGRGLADKASSRVKPTKTRIPIKKDSTLPRKLIEEIITQQQQQQDKQVGESCMIDRIKSMFPPRRSPSPPPSQLQHYLKPDLVHDNYSRIFESMRQVDEKNLDGLLVFSAAKLRVTSSLRRQQIERHLKNDNDLLKKEEQHIRNHRIRMLLIQLAVLVIFTLTNIYFVYDYLRKT